MIRRPPRSTLFPYTTLFRSICDLVRVDLKTGDVGVIAKGSPRRVVYRPRWAPDGTWIAASVQEEDRKSTRLNSSHANISYAVFCLKKKKKTTTLSSGLPRTN